MNTFVILYNYQKLLIDFAVNFFLWQKLRNYCLCNCVLNLSKDTPVVKRDVLARSEYKQ